MTVRSAWHINPGQTRADTRLSPVGTWTALDATQTRAGVVPGGTPMLLTGSTMTGSVSIGRAVVQGTATQGAYPVAITAAEAITVANGHASLPRIDSVFLVAYDQLYDTSGLTQASITYTQGTAASSPTAPTAPATGTAYLKLWDIAVPAGASAGSPINWATALTDRRVYTVPLGGILPTSDSVSGAYIGQWRDNPGTGALERWNGTAWIGWSASLGGIAPSGTTASYTGQYRDGTYGLERWNGTTYVPFGTWTAYTPTWTASGTAPGPVAGQLTARTMQIGHTVTDSITIAMPSGTTFGTGTYAFGLSRTAATRTNGAWIGPALAIHSGVAVFTGTCYVSSNSSTAVVYTPTAAGGSSPSQWAATNPFTWATNDSLTIQVSYEIP